MIFSFMFIYYNSVYIFLSAIYLYHMTNTSHPQLFDQLNRVYRAAPGFLIFSTILSLNDDEYDDDDDNDDVNNNNNINNKGNNKSSRSSRNLSDVAAKSAFTHFFFLVLCFIF